MAYQPQRQNGLWCLRDQAIRTALAACMCGLSVLAIAAIVLALAVAIAMMKAMMRAVTRIATIVIVMRIEMVSLCCALVVEL